jgi:hypothetical protein
LPAVSTKDIDEIELPAKMAVENRLEIAGGIRVDDRKLISLGFTQVNARLDLSAPPCFQAHRSRLRRSRQIATNATAEHR